MSEKQIQKFLEKKKSRLATYSAKGTNIPSKKPASYIIWKLAQTWGINPQVILATLQKESSLVTMPNPETWRFNSAMGYGCPDGKDCNKSYKGFVNQINMASYQFRYNYEALKSNSQFADGDGDIHGVGSFACNGKTRFYSAALRPGNKVKFYGKSGKKDKTVNIANEATSSFLCYTPHVGPFGETGYSGSDNLVLFFTAWFGSPLGGGYEFRTERLSAPSGAVNKVNSSSLGDSVETITDGDKIYTLYRDGTNKTLRLAYWNGSKWSDRILDGQGATTRGAVNNNVGTDITAIKWNGQIQVYYYDSTAKSLRHAWLKKGVWKTETMDGTSNSLAGTTDNVGKNGKVIVWRGQLQLYYYNESTKSIRHTWWPGDDRWHFENLDGVKNSTVGGVRNVGTKPIEAIVWKDQIQIYYYDATSKTLRHTWWPNDKRWHSEAMDGSKGSVVGKAGRVIDSGISAIVWKDQIQMYYHDSNSGQLIHTWWPGDKRWHSEMMDGESTGSVLGNAINAGQKVIAKPFGKNIIIAYYDNADAWGDRTSAWRVAYWEHSMWNEVIIDGGSTDSASGSDKNIPTTSDIGFAEFGKNKVQMFYKGANGELMHAWTK